MARLTREWALDAVLVSAIAVLAVLYLASIGPYWNISPDSATYVGWARALVSGEPYARGPVQPPATSLIYAAILSFRPDGYTALNAGSVILVLLSVAVAGALVARQAGRRVAMIIVLLCLASTRLFHESTQLLSEPPYLLFSMGALLLIDRRQPDESPDAWRSILGGCLMIATVLTRTIGLALIAAVVVVEGWRLVRRRSPNRVLLAFAGASVLAVVLWELLGSRQSYLVNWFRMFARDDVWTPGSGAASPLELVERFMGNARHVLATGQLLLNTWAPPGPLLRVLLYSAGLGAVLAGLAVALRRHLSVTAVYTVVYLTVAILHVLGGGGDPLRLLAPVLPLLLLFAFEAIRWLKEQAASRDQSGLAQRILVGALGVFVALYAARGVSAVRAGIRESRMSPFGDYPIKRPSNFDLQRQAMWVRDHSQSADRFASFQRDMIEVIAERQGRALSPGMLQPAERFPAWLAENRIRFVFVDHRSSTGPLLLAAVDSNPSTFRLVSNLAGASLYEVVSAP